MYAALNRTLLNSGGGSLSLANYSTENPIYIAHRGGSLVVPEGTTEGYRDSFAAGNKVLEMDVRELSDGGLAISHEETVDVYTTSTGNVADLTTAQWQALVMDTDVWFRGGYGNLTPPLFPEILAAHRNQVIFVPEAKSTGAGEPLVAALLAAGIPRQQALVQSFVLAELAEAVNTGYPALLLTITTALDTATAIAAGVTWGGASTAAADSVFTDAITAGLKMLAWTVDRRWQRDYYLSLGVSGFFSDDPQYLAGTAPLSTTDNFSAQKWQPGMKSHYGTAAIYRGQFTAPDKWGIPLNGAAFTSVLQGWASPIKGDADADSYTIDFMVTFNSVNAGDQTRWASVFLGKNDKEFGDGAAATADQQGFHILLRKAGNMSIFKRTTSAATQVATGTTVAISDGEEVAYRITVSPTAITVYRLDGSGDVTHTVTYAETDSAFKGGYVFLCRNGASVDFRGIAIT